MVVTTFIDLMRQDKFFDNKEQAEEYVRENIAPFDRNKVKEYLTKRYKDSGISDIKIFT